MTTIYLQYRMHLPKDQQRGFADREKEQSLVNRFKTRLVALGK
jgi:hypothetical protein